MSVVAPLIVGRKFSRLTILAEIDRAPADRGNRRYFAVCDCGNFRTTRLSWLKTGASNSCGCAREEKRRTHGLSKTSEYAAWRGMIARCYNPNIKAYKNYGARGVTVCERWRESFENFVSDMGMKPSARLSIERRDVLGPYSPENCCWATPKQQARNTRRSVRFQYQGRIVGLAEIAEELSLNYGCLQQRIYHGASPEDAIAAEISKPVRTR